MTSSTTSLLPATHGFRTLLWWTQADLDAVGDDVGRTFTAWTADWIGGTSHSDVHVTLAHEHLASAEETWVPVGTSDECAAWVQVRAGAVEEILPIVFPPVGEQGPTISKTGIAWAVAAKAWDALSGALRACIGLDVTGSQAAPDRSLTTPWSGSVVISLAMPGQRVLSLLLNPAAVIALRERAGMSVAKRPGQGATAAVPLTDALSECQLALQVELSPCELDLGSLESLRVGDIVPLAHSLDAPLLVMSAKDVHVCAGFLGLQGRHKAIELVRQPMSAQVPVFDPHTQREV